MRPTMTFLASMALLCLASASDTCPPTYCTLGSRCTYDPNGPHCCGANDQRNVLQCVNGKWAVRNRCDTNQFCTCTGSHDLVCRNISKEKLATNEPQGEAEPEAAT